jgi:hypothetical protein
VLGLTDRDLGTPRRLSSVCRVSAARWSEGLVADTEASASNITDVFTENTLLATAGERGRHEQCKGHPRYRVMVGLELCSCGMADNLLGRREESGNFGFAWTT